jgi:hypothetical protein
MTLLILFVAIAGAYGLTRVERKRDVPWLPPQLETLIAAEAGYAAAPVDEPPAPLAPHGTAGGNIPVPVRPTPPKPGPAKPDPAAAQSLVPIEAQTTVAPKKGEISTAVVLKIGPDGTYLRWAGYDPGSFVTIAELMATAAENPEFQLVIAPDRKTPWKYVHWALELARDSGITDVGIGVTALAGTTAVPEMQMFATPQSNTPYESDPDFPEIRVEVTIGAEGKPQWTVNDKAATVRQELFAAVGEVNTEYAEMMQDGDYARSPAKTPWLVVAGPEIPAKDVIQTLAAIRMAAVYTVRFGGEFPPNPGLSK